MYKVSKIGLGIEQFRGQRERQVKQELYAHFTLMAMTRMFARHSEEAARSAPDGHGKPARTANFAHSLRTVAQELEALYLQHARTLEASVRRVLEGIARCRPRRRPGRSHERRSRRPANKWRDRKKKSTS